MKEMMQVKGEGRLDKVTEKKLRIGNKERKKERKRERKKEREKERKKKKRQKEREVSKKNGLIIQLRGDVRIKEKNKKRKEPKQKDKYLCP